MTGEVFEAVFEAVFDAVFEDVFELVFEDVFDLDPFIPIRDSRLLKFILDWPNLGISLRIWPLRRLLLAVLPVPVFAEVGIRPSVPLSCREQHSHLP